MQIIVGLGNYAKKYDLTRHNIGFDLIDKLSLKYDVCSFLEKFDGLFAKGVIANKECILFKPAKFMSNSGAPIQKLMNFFKININNLIIIHDDIDFELGKIKIKIGGGNAGHNGIKSIDNAIGSNYKRLRLGVGRPQNNIEVADYVLQKFSNNELKKAEEVINKVVDLFELIINDQDQSMLNEFYKS